MSRGQSRAASLVAALANLAAGAALAFVANLVILPMAGVSITPGQAGLVSLAFAALSAARSFVLRRFF